MDERDDVSSVEEDFFEFTIQLINEISYVKKVFKSQSACKRKTLQETYSKI